MKKIYEKPVVELTVFDVEDIITLSIIDTTTQSFLETQTAIDNLKSEIANAKSGYTVGVGKWNY